MRGLELIPRPVRERIPALGSQELAGEGAVAYARLTSPDSGWSWYVTELDASSGECFGLVDGMECELGYFALTELASVRGPLGLAIKVDALFVPAPLARLRTRLAAIAA